MGCTSSKASNISVLTFTKGEPLNARSAVRYDNDSPEISESPLLLENKRVLKEDPLRQAIGPKTYML